MYRSRMIGGIALVAGLCTIGYEAVATIGLHGILGDLAFAAAGLSFAVFGVLLKLWSIAPIRAVAITSVLSLVLIPIEYFVSGFQPMIAAGFRENLILALVQGVLSGFARDLSVHPRGSPAGRCEGGGFSGTGAAVHPDDRLSVSRNVPTVLQLVGLV